MLSSHTQGYCSPNLDFRYLGGACGTERTEHLILFGLAGVHWQSASDDRALAASGRIRNDFEGHGGKPLKAVKSISLPMNVVAVVGPFHSAGKNGLMGLNKQDKVPESNLTDKYVEDKSALRTSLGEYVEDTLALRTSLGDSLNAKQVQTTESRSYTCRHIFAFLQLVGRRLRAHFAYEILEIGASLGV